VNGVAPQHAELRLIDYMWMHNLNVSSHPLPHSLSSLISL
jgi:hypothetical protein